MYKHHKKCYAYILLATIHTSETKTPTAWSVSDSADISYDP